MYTCVWMIEWVVGIYSVLMCELTKLGADLQLVEA